MGMKKLAIFLVLLYVVPLLAQNPGEPHSQNTTSRYKRILRFFGIGTQINPNQQVQQYNQFNPCQLPTSTTPAPVGPVCPYPFIGPNQQPLVGPPPYTPNQPGYPNPNGQFNTHQGGQPPFILNPVLNGQPPFIANPNSGAEPPFIPNPISGGQPPFIPNPNSGESEPPFIPNPNRGYPNTGPQPEFIPNPIPGGQPPFIPNPNRQNPGSLPEFIPNIVSGGQPPFIPNPNRQNPGSQPEFIPNQVSGGQPPFIPNPNRQNPGSQPAFIPNPVPGGQPPFIPNPNRQNPGSQPEFIPNPVPGGKPPFIPNPALAGKQPHPGSQTPYTPNPAPHKPNNDEPVSADPSNNPRPVQPQKPEKPTVVEPVNPLRPESPEIVHPTNPLEPNLPVSVNPEKPTSPEQAIVVVPGNRPQPQKPQIVNPNGPQVYPPRPFVPPNGPHFIPISPPNNPVNIDRPFYPGPGSYPIPFPPHPGTFGLNENPFDNPFSRPVPCSALHSFIPNGFSSVSVNSTHYSCPSQCPFFLNTLKDQPPCSTLDSLERLGASKMRSLIINSGLEPLFTQTEGYTIFAPLDVAFNRLPKWFTNTLQTDEKLRKVFVLQHLVKDDVPISKMGNDYLILTARPGASRLRLNVYYPESNYTIYTVDGSRILRGDILTSNGRVHLTDKVIMPNPPRYAADYLREKIEFESFWNLVKNLDLSIFSSDRPITVFIPVNEAVNKINTQALLDDKVKLQNFRDYHVLNRTIYSSGLVNNEYVITNFNKEIKLGVISDGFSKTLSSVNGFVKLLKTDIPLVNGVAHVIDLCFSEKGPFYGFEDSDEFEFEFGVISKRSMYISGDEKNLVF